MVYLLFSNYYDYCDNWVTLVDVFGSNSSAKKEKERLDNANCNVHESYFITEHSVKD